MAQFFWSAEDYAVGETPNDVWQPELNVDSFVIDSDQDGKFLSVNANSGAKRTVLSYIPAGGNVSAVKIWSSHKITTNDAGSMFAMGTDLHLVNGLTMVRAGVHGTTAVGSFAGSSNTKTLQQYRNGSHSNLDFRDFLALNHNELFEQYFITETAGPHLVRFWGPSQTEPTGWQLSDYSQTYSPGKIGILRFTGEYRLYKVGFGTDGDVEPREPPRSITMWARENNIYKHTENLFIRNGGTWKEAQKLWARYNGVWRESE